MHLAEDAKNCQEVDCKDFEDNFGFQPNLILAQDYVICLTS